MTKGLTEALTAQEPWSRASDPDVSVPQAHSLCGLLPGYRFCNFLPPSLSTWLTSSGPSEVALWASRKVPPSRQMKPGLPGAAARRRCPGSAVPRAGMSTSCLPLLAPYWEQMGAAKAALLGPSHSSPRAPHGRCPGKASRGGKPQGNSPTVTTATPAYRVISVSRVLPEVCFIDVPPSHEGEREGLWYLFTR